MVVSGAISGGFPNQFEGKTIALGVCGGIAAYRACDLIRELYRRGAAKVICLMTQSAERFITAEMLRALSRQPVYHFDGQSDETGLPVHIKLAQEADLLLILPATANLIAKCAHGLGDDLLTTTFITFSDKPVIFAPAMNTRMWRHPIFQDNVKRLEMLENISFVSPSSGLLACGEFGNGHLASQDIILQQVYAKLHPMAGLMQGKQVLVTAGGTQEAIDPVRCISNHSSGKMGVALADELWAMGATVTLLGSLALSRHLTEKPYPILPFQSVNDLQLLLETHWPHTDWLMMAAAVSDFRPEQIAEKKIKKTTLSEFSENKIPVSQSLHLTLNPDLIANIGNKKQPGQRLIGFAAESEDLLENAKKKLASKNLDAIVVNDISRDDIGFQSDANEVNIIFANGKHSQLPKALKPLIARHIIHQCIKMFDIKLSSHSEETLRTTTPLEQWSLFS